MPCSILLSSVALEPEVLCLRNIRGLVKYNILIVFDWQDANKHVSLDLNYYVMYSAVSQQLCGILDYLPFQVRSGIRYKRRKLHTYMQTKHFKHHTKHPQLAGARKFHGNNPQNCQCVFSTLSS